MSKRRRGERRHQHGGNSSWAGACQVLLFPACWQSNRRASSPSSWRRSCSCPPEHRKDSYSKSTLQQRQPHWTLSLRQPRAYGLLGRLLWDAARLCSRWPEAAILRDSNSMSKWTVGDKQLLYIPSGPQDRNSPEYFLQTEGAGAKMKRHNARKVLEWRQSAHGHMLRTWGGPLLIACCCPCLFTGKLAPPTEAGL